MLKTLRMLYAVVTTLLLAMGYAASQIAAWNGTATSYAAKVDQPSVRALALVLLLSAFVLVLLPDRSQDGSV